jgi:anthranilate synthase component 2
MNRTLVVDNYDSFTYNLVHLIEDILQDEVTVLRNDGVKPSDLELYHTVIFSPGPGLPEEANHLIDLVQESMRLKMKVLGVCLGHQALGMASGAKLKNLATVHHGVDHPLHIVQQRPIFSELPQKITIGRYHSWVLGEGLGKDWVVNCRDVDGEIMGIQHKEFPFFGVQFHPESVLSRDGKTILKNFLDLTPPTP